MPELLEFEEPIGVLLKEIEAMSMLPETEQRRQDIARLEQRITAIRGELYSRLTPWQRVLVARHPSRPTTLDYIEKLFTEFVEIRGDRRFADDHAIVCGMARYKDDEILVVGHQKGSDTKQKIYRNFGYARPEGYRKALRAMQLAPRSSSARSSASSTRLPPTPASSRRSAALPKRSPSICARWRCSPSRSSSSFTAKAAAAARWALPSAIAS